MISQKSKLVIKDNSGFTLAQCINLKKGTSGYGTYGDTIKVAIQKSKVKKPKKLQSGKKNNSNDRSLQTVVLIQTKKSYTRLDGSSIRFAQNAGVVVNEKNSRLSFAFKRVTTAVPFELKKNARQLNLLKLARSLI